MKVGFIGTGNMGRPLVGNLVRKGFGVVAYDLEPAALAAGLGASPAASAAAVAGQSDLVITMLPSASHVESAYLGAGGVLEGVPGGRLCVDMSTIDPATSRRVAARLAERGVRFIDAPVSGGVGGAEKGTLAIMVGGEAADLEEARPALAAMGANIVGAPPPRAGRCSTAPGRRRWPRRRPGRPAPSGRRAGWRSRSRPCPRDAARRGR
jgi:3-hydroxyisobutyrate dehydrogenase